MKRSAVTVMLLAFLMVVTVVLVGPTTIIADGHGERQVALEYLRMQFPDVQVYKENGRITRIYGQTFGSGDTPEQAAETFRMKHSGVFGAKPEELLPVSLLDDGRHTQPLMYDRETGRYKFILVYHSQYRDGIPVFRSDLRLLVRNELGYPVVLAVSALHDLGDFEFEKKSDIRFKLAVTAATAEIPGLTDFTEPQTVIWAGVGTIDAEPTLAIKFIGWNDKPERWLFLADAATGEILYKEDLIIFEDVVGDVQGKATQGKAADFCEEELPEPMPWARVNIASTIAHADSNGDFVIPNAGSSPVTVESRLRGLWFRVYNQAGSDALLSQTVTPPGPANFMHNEPNTDEYCRAQVNGYLQANIVRDFTLTYNPDYPGLQENEFPVKVNESGGYCPGNAWYDGSSITFCSAGGGYPNTAWSSVVHHEYGHHLVRLAGSGQGQYGEGQSDVMGLLILDDPGTGYGFYGDCNTPLRNADNDMQYPCDGGIHYCGQLLSGCVWSTRNELSITNPDTYRDIISNLAINAILFHTGNMITPEITIDYLTLDDDDGDISNGTPHYAEICAGFGAHNMDCPGPSVPAVISTSPTQNELDVPANTNISVTFNVDMDETTINDSTFVVNAWSTGVHQGSIRYNPGTRTATLDPTDDFEEGEVVTVVLTDGIESSDGIPLQSSYVWSFTTTVENGAGTFDPHSVYPVGDAPWSVFAADLDGDGHLDLMTANWNSDNVSVLLNYGDGTFPPPSFYLVGDKPASVFAADLNGDGHLDLATALSGSNEVSVSLGNGDGIFAPASVYPVAGAPVFIFATNLDGDGHLDLITANWNSDDVSVLLNYGDGTFVPHSDYPVGDWPWSVFAADLDGDGDLDLTTANRGHDNVSVLLNNGNATFGPHSVYPVGDNPGSVFAADLDEDGDVDLTTANMDSDNVSVLLNIGDGTFAPHSVYPVGEGPHSVFAADLDGDDDLDLATGNTDSDDVSVLLNVGDGTFAPDAVYQVGDFPRSVFAADFDGDGDLDLAAANSHSDEVSVLLNQDCPRIVSTSPEQSGLNAPVNTSISVTFDVDMDETTINDSTFVVNAWSTGLHSGSISYNSGARTATLDPTEDFEEGEVVAVVLTADIQSSEGTPLCRSYLWSFTTVVDDGPACFTSDSVYAVSDDPYSVFSADLDGDGYIDLVTANYESGSVSVLMNYGDSTFGPPSSYPVGSAPHSVFAADLDGDGDLDLATANRWSGNASVLLNYGNGTFAPHSTYTVGYSPFSVFAADLDGDRDLDLAVTYDPIGEEGYVAVLLNYGDATFALPSAYLVGNKPSSVFAADLEGDGDLDLATANRYSDNVSILLNYGDGTFAPRSDHPVSGKPHSVFAADLDGDSWLDLATANHDSNNVSVLLNTGSGSFAPHSNYPVGDLPWSVFAADLDGDGDLDLTSANEGSDNVSVLLNYGDGIFASQSAYPVGDSPRSVLAADLDGDGDLDLATANRLSHNVSVVLNYLPGDCNADHIVNVGDVPYLVSYLYKGGPPPRPYGAGNVNCDDIIDVGDVNYLVSYLYKGGPPPQCEGCCKNGERNDGGLLQAFLRRASSSQVGFASPTLLPDGSVELALTGEFSTRIAAVDLEIRYDGEKIEVLSADVADMTEHLQIYYDHKDQLLKIGIMDIYGEHSIQLGQGALMTLTLKGTDLSSLEISKVILVDEQGNVSQANVTEKLETSSSSRPAEFSLAQNYPNPFNPETQISYALPERCQAKLSIYNVRGQKVKVLVNEFQAAGHNTVMWDGKNEDGQEVASGIYFYRLEAKAFNETKSMVLLK